MSYFYIKIQEKKEIELLKDTVELIKENCIKTSNKYAIILNKNNHSNCILDKEKNHLSVYENINNFKKIKGINSQIEKNLYSLGIFHYEQIANWTNKNVEWIEGFLELPFHVRNNQWVEQARVLKNGNETTYSQQVENGEIEVD